MLAFGMEPAKASSREMKHTGRLVSATALLVFFAHAACASSAEERRLRDLVRVADGKFLYDDLALCELRLPGSTPPKFQIRSHAEAPSQGVVSRDHFVSLITQHEIIFGLGIAQVHPGISAMDAVRALRCTPLDAPIGTPDLELELSMTAEGMQVEVTDTAAGKKTRSVHTWKELSE